MTPLRAMFVDSQGKRPAADVLFRLESRDAVKLAKFFVALGFVAEIQAVADGRRFVLAKTDGARLEIYPAREPRPTENWSMTLIVDDAAAAVARVATLGGKILSPLKDIPGGKKCVVASPEGQRVVVAERHAPGAVATTEPTVVLVDQAGAQPIKPPAATDEYSIAGDIAVAEEEYAAAGSLLETLAAAEATASFGPTVLAAEDAVSTVAPVPDAMQPEPLTPLHSAEEPTEKRDAGPTAEERWRTIDFEERKVLQRVRKATLFTIFSYAAFFAATLFVFAVMDDVRAASRYRGGRPDATLAYISIGFSLAGWAAVIIGKFFVATQSFRRVNTDWVATALCCDVGGLMLSMLSSFASIRPWCTLGTAVLWLVSSVAFARYLGLVAAAVEDKLLLTGSRIVLLFYGAIGLFVFLTAFGAVLNGMTGDPSMLAVGAMGTVASAVPGQLGFIALNVMFARRLRPPPDAIPGGR